MRWPWSKGLSIVRSDKPRGTLTFLRDGGVILGMPYELNQDEFTEIADYIARFKPSELTPRILVFPFPVDVIDRREVAS